FDADALTVKLPEGQECTVVVRVVSSREGFESHVEAMQDGRAVITLTGRCDDDNLRDLERDLEQALSQGPQKIVVQASGLTSLSEPAARALVFARQRLPFEEGAGIYLVG